MPASRFGQALWNACTLFLRELTTPAWLPAWRELCERTGATLVPRSLSRVASVRWQYRGFTIELRNLYRDKADFTCFSADCPSDGSLQFSVARKSLWTRLKKLVGSSQFYTGDREFDEAITIFGDSSTQLTKLFEAADFCRLLQSEPEVELKFEHKPNHRSGHLTTNEPTGFSTLRLETSGFVNDLERLQQLLEVFQRTLGRLIELRIITSAEVDSSGGEGK